jgi:hypothetical protein
MQESRKAESSKGLRIVAPAVSHRIPTDTCQNDPDLTAVINACEQLPATIRARVVAMVRASLS